MLGSRRSGVAGGRLGEAAEELLGVLGARGLKLVCAESCTGGLVTAAITDIPGSSDVLWGGVASYSNECKTRLLGVPEELLAAVGAVSREVAASMALGALEASGAEGADLSLAITGIAGPGGGSEEKPVGLVYFAWASRSGVEREARRVFSGDRGGIREAAALEAMSVASQVAAEIAASGPRGA